MKVPDLTDCLEGADFDMSKEANRLATFPSNWPCKGRLLTPENMAAAGFYYVGKKGSDDVRSFCCYRDLSEWEEEDDPWKEHAKRSCFFANLGKRQGQLTVAEYLMMMAEREKCRLKKVEVEFKKVKELIEILEHGVVSN